jgi:hypothetical protein
MNQRVISSSSMLLKGITLKSADWRPSDVEMQRDISVSSAPCPHRLSASERFTSMASLPFKQFDLQHRSSSRLASTNDAFFKSPYTTATGNATWDDIVAHEPTNALDKFDLKISCFEEEFVIETFREKTPKQIDTRLMTSLDLAALKEEDAFMYYSIPAVKKAHWENNEVDLKDLEKSSPYVKRSSAISFESAVCGMEDIDIARPENHIMDLDIPSLSEGFYHTSFTSDNSEEELFFAYFDC